MDCSLPGSSVHGILQARILEWGCHSLLQGIFPTQGPNPGLLHCRQVLDSLSHQGSPVIEELIIITLAGRGDQRSRRTVRVHVGVECQVWHQTAGPCRATDGVTVPVVLGPGRGGSVLGGDVQRQPHGCVMGGSDPWWWWASRKAAAMARGGAELGWCLVPGAWLCSPPLQLLLTPLSWVPPEAWRSSHRSIPASVTRVSFCHLPPATLAATAEGPV